VMFDFLNTLTYLLTYEAYNAPEYSYQILTQFYMGKKTEI